MLRHKTKSPVLSDQCELEFVVVASTATTMSTLACKSAFRNAARAAQPLRIENPESTALPPNLEFFDLGCAYVGDTLAEWLEGRYSVDNLRKRGGKWGRKPALRSETASRSLQQLRKLVSHEAHLFVRHSLVQDIPW